MTVSIRAFAKINLTLRVLGTRSDGYHELRTVFQSIALDDALTFAPARGAFEIMCDDPRCPTGPENIVWNAAARLWQAAGRSGAPRGARVHIDKRIPLQAGLGGGSADAAAALRALAVLWRVKADEGALRESAAALGADVPFFLEGGTAFGAGRGDVLFPLPDVERQWLVIAVPRFGVSTKEAYEWFDATRDVVPRSELRNDLEAAAIARHPEIGDLLEKLERSGAAFAAMSGSGAAVFGLFRDRAAAEAAADGLVGRPAGQASVIVTRTLSRAEHRRLTRPVLARK
jgi:4-diphosphocytidyl-2-C-methyl-D-erythritol kinase